MQRMALRADADAEREAAGKVRSQNQPQVPAPLDILRDSEMVPERRITPFFTIWLESGSSSPSQSISIQIGIDGYGVMQHVNERAYFYCSKLPRFAEAAFNQSTIVVH